MAEATDLNKNEESSNTVNDSTDDFEVTSTEIIPCSQCETKEIYEESVGLCVDCKCHLCFKCVNSHKTGDKKSHIIIDEIGRTLCSRQLEKIFVICNTCDREINTRTEIKPHKCNKKTPKIRPITQAQNKDVEPNEDFPTEICSEHVKSPPPFKAREDSCQVSGRRPNKPVTKSHSVRDLYAPEQQVERRQRARSFNNFQRERSVKRKSRKCVIS